MSFAWWPLILFYISFGSSINAQSDCKIETYKDHPLYKNREICVSWSYYYKFVKFGFHVRLFVSNYEQLYLFSIKLICFIHNFITYVSQVGHICWNGLCMHDEWFSGQLMSNHGIPITIILEWFWHKLNYFLLCQIFNF